MKILPEHETLCTIMSKLIQVVWITFELPMDEIHVSNSSGTISRDPVTNKKSTFPGDVDEQEHYYDDDWNSIALSSTSSTMDLSFVPPPSSLQNENHYDHYIPPDLRMIDNAMIERDIPCRATGVLARGIY